MDRQNSSVPAVAGNDVTLYVPFELSSEIWLVGVYSPADGKQMSMHKLSAGDVAGVMKLIEKAKARLRALGAGAITVLSCYEAGRDGFWLDRELRARGIANRVLDAASIEVPRKSRRAKTDRLDLRGLLRVLMALARGESDCRIVRVPTLAEEDARRPGREREGLVRERGKHTNRLTSLCALHGIRGYNPLRTDRRARLAALRTASGEELPPRLREEMTRQLDRLELVLAQLKAVEAARDALARAPEPAPERPAQAAGQPVAAAPAKASGAAATSADIGQAMILNLVKLRAIGPELATLFTREVFYRDFSNRRQVGAFFGLDGSPWRSGKLEREQGISKAGNRRARVAAIEQAWLWVRYQPDSALSRWFRARTANQAGPVRRKMIVAMARKLMVALWRYGRFGVVPEGAQFKTV